MNFSITINGEGAELTNALKTLKTVLGENIAGEGAVTASIQPTTPIAPPVTPPVAPPIQTVTPGQAVQAYQQQQDYTYQGSVSAQYPQQPAPVAPPAQPSAVPTAAPMYTLEQLGVAAGPLVDAGRGQELAGWLQQRGAAALTNLDKSFYGEFATYLRSLGARI